MNWYILGFQIGNALLVLSWVVLVIIALRTLAIRRVPPVQQMLWGILALVIPIIGAALCIFYAQERYPLQKA